MKRYFIRLLLIFASVTFSLSLFFYFAKSNQQKKVFPSQVVNSINFGLPVRLTIPVINVNAGIQSLGVTPQGTMEVPDNAVDVGWFKIGPRPGEKGSAVMAGHLDGKNDEKGVFIDLYKLKVGDKLSVVDDKGKTVTFAVTESRIYDPGYADEVFSGNDSARLNLITCDGLWNGTKKSYDKRLVVFTNIIN